MLYYNADGINVDTFLSLVHLEIKSRWMIEEAAAQQQAEANELTYYFKQLKMARVPNNPVEAELNDQWAELAHQIFLLQKQGHSGLKSSARLFRRGHKDTKAALKGADDIFEEELYYTIQALEKVGAKDGVTIASGVKLTGQTALNVPAIGDQYVKEVIEDYSKRVSKALVDETDDATAPYYKPTARAGKTDVTGTSVEVNITTDIKPEWQRFFQLLQGATFSAKNYQSGHIGKDNEWIATTHPYIQLGKTDIYKAFAGVMSVLGADNAEINARFAQSYWAYQRYKNESVAKHMYHIRFIYELTGAGLQDAFGGKEGVKFLIYNDPNSDIITVTSTAWLIKEMFDGREGMLGRNPFGAIRLHQRVISGT